MQPGTLGEGGSRAGATRRVWKPWLPSSRRRLCSAPSLRLRCSPTEPTLRECLSSLNSVAPVPSGSPWLPSCEDMSLSSQTKPDEPDLLKVCEDRCSPAMVTHLCGLVCDWRCLCHCVYGVQWRRRRKNGMAVAKYEVHKWVRTRQIAGIGGPMMATRKFAQELGRLGRFVCTLN